MAAWYTLSIPEVGKKLGTDLEHGLSEGEARNRLAANGPNELPQAESESPAIVFLRQFQSPLIYILLLAGIFLLLIREYIDATFIFFVLVFNAIVGAIQEGRAEKKLSALRTLVKTDAVVWRDGKEFIVPDEEIVLGDVIALQAGEKVPADARIILSRNLRTDEASLTGESGSISKDDIVITEENVQLSSQRNMVFKGTLVVAGSGKAVVTATGKNTVIGAISAEVATIETEIPLRKDIRTLSRIIIIAVVCISAAIISGGILQGKTLNEMFRTAVSLAVSIIPEGLPVVLTLVLATSVWHMAKRNALVKRLQAVEALGQARIIAVDKTGTITKNEMVVSRIFVDGRTFKFTGTGYEPKGEVYLEENVVDPANHPELLLAGKIASLSTDVQVSWNDTEKRWHVAGDPTEAALLVVAEKMGFHKEDLEREMPLLLDIPFDNRNQYHAAVHQMDERQFITVCGEPGIVLGLAKHIWRHGETKALTQEIRDHLEDTVVAMSSEGLRVIACGFREGTAKTVTNELGDLTFVGLFGIMDAIRPEVFEAMEKARAAGMRVVMITGDHKNTAIAIAREAGIYKDGDEVLTGKDLDQFDEHELDKRLERTSIFARVSPEHKLKIIEGYRRRKEIVAMTGDGVNDAPSLVAADLGVAMGKIGTDVAKEAADIVLLDDNFGSIVSAIEEGRGLYKTIKKVILYLFSTSVGEVLTIGGALLLAYPLPLLPAQIIWLNLVTDGFLTVALAMEPRENNLFKGRFSGPGRFLIDRLLTLRIFTMGVPMAAGTLFLFSMYFKDDLTKGWTIALTTLAIFQWLNAWNCRSDRESVWTSNPFSNRFLIAATFIVIVLQVIAVHVPIANSILRTTPLTLAEWGMATAMAFLVVCSEELRKAIARGMNRSPA